MTAANEMRNGKPMAGARVLLPVQVVFHHAPLTGGTSPCATFPVEMPTNIHSRRRSRIIHSLVPFEPHRLGVQGDTDLFKQATPLLLRTPLYDCRESTNPDNCTGYPNGRDLAPTEAEKHREGLGTPLSWAGCNRVWGVSFGEEAASLGDVGGRVKADQAVGAGGRGGCNTGRGRVAILLSPASSRISLIPFVVCRASAFRCTHNKLVRKIAHFRLKFRRVQILTSTHVVELCAVIGSSIDRSTELT
jgi:hypothetical protein